jgi:hypothetical protein
VISRNIQGVLHILSGTLEMLSAQEIRQAALIVRKWLTDSNLSGGAVSLSRGLRSEYKRNGK